MDTKNKQLNRQRRHKRVRATITGTSERPRVSVFKSNKNIFVQLIDDRAGKTVLSGRAQAVQQKKASKTDRAINLGEKLSEKAKDAGIKEVVFDRGGFKYHGRIKAVADGLRKGGIKF